MQKAVKLKRQSEAINAVPEVVQTRNKEAVSITARNDRIK